MHGQQGGGTPPQHSPDGKWWWDGQKWVAVRQARDLTSATGAKTRLPHHRRSFWIGLGVVTLLLVGFGACMAAVANSPRTQPGANTASVTSTPSPTATPSGTPASTAPTAAPTATPTPPPKPTAAPTVAAAPPPTAAPATLAGCYPLSNSGTCYEPGEFCRTSDHGRTGRAGNGVAIVCEYNNGWRWEPA